MYKQFFGLQANPFNVNPDPRFLYLNRNTEEALSCLTYGIESRKGFILLTGEVGTGKTTLLNKLLDWLHARQAATAFIFNSQVSVQQFFELMLADFGIACESKSRTQMLVTLNHWLLERYGAGQMPVLIIDEAQNLSRELLEEIRLLTNLETPREKLLQIVLSGQIELMHKLRQPELRQLRQRIFLHCKTEKLTLPETYRYIALRLQVAGSDGRQIFTPQAVEAIHYYSRGVPRVINLLCEHALISAFVDQQPEIAEKIINDVAHEFELDEIAPTRGADEIAAVRVPASPGPNGVHRELLEALQHVAKLIEQLRRDNAATARGEVPRGREERLVLRQLEHKVEHSEQMLGTPSERKV